MRIHILSTIAFLLLLISPGAVASKSRHRVVGINPPTLLDPVPLGFQQISVDTRTAVAYVSGQTSINQTGSVIGTTLTEQLVVVEKNLKIALDAVGADISDIIQLVTFVKNFDDFPALTAAFKRLGSPTNTVVSTPALAFPGLLVEIQATVAVPRHVVLKLIRSSK